MGQRLTLGSLFDGSGGFPLAGLLSGIEPLWGSEIEPFAIRVTTKRIPQMKHYGDISTLDGATLPPVDIITFGSPCQDMSIAGKREGLGGSRSSLFYEAIRIVKEMRKATNGTKPRFLVWENVLGAFSSNKGQDFKAVLEAIISIKEPSATVPAPNKKGWSHADYFVGDGWSVGYRVLDAQWWGVPQRRQRIFLVADFAGGCASKILFESEGVSRYSAEGFRSWQRATSAFKVCAGATGKGIGLVLNDQGGCHMSVTEEVVGTLRAEAHHPPVLLALDYHPADSRISISTSHATQTLTSRMGTGGGNVPLILKGYGICSNSSHAMRSDNPLCGFYETNVSKTVDTAGANPNCNQGGIAVVAFTQNQRDELRDLEDVSGALSAESGAKQQTYVLQGSMVGRSEHNGPQGSGVNENISFTLDSKDRHAVVYSMTTGSFAHASADASQPIMARDYKAPSIVASEANVASSYVVRRLTPTECARLQGFPDWWCSSLETENPSEEELAFWRDVFETHRRIVSKSSKPKSDKQILKWLRFPHSDSAEYKLWGNGVALPCVWFVLAGIVAFT